MTPTLSIIIPAYQEERRLPATLRAISDYCRQHPHAIRELLIVDDGSTDRTCEVCSQWRAGAAELHLLRHRRNLGKGAAMRTGVRHAQGDLILIMDADGAVPIDQEAKLRQEIASGGHIACGSRLLAHSENSRTVTRRVMGNAFAWLVRLAFGLPVRDTQCGFKMFLAPAARTLFGAAREPGYLADVEVLLHARDHAMIVREVAVRYRDVPGSKLSLCRDTWRMMAGLCRLRISRMSLSLPLVTGNAGIWRRKASQLVPELLSGRDEANDQAKKGTTIFRP